MGGWLLAPREDAAALLRGPRLLIPSAEREHFGGKICDKSWRVQERYQDRGHGHSTSLDLDGSAASSNEQMIQS